VPAGTSEVSRSLVTEIADALVGLVSEFGFSLAAVSVLSAGVSAEVIFPPVSDPLVNSLLPGCSVVSSDFGGKIIVGLRLLKEWSWKFFSLTSTQFLAYLCTPR